MKTPFRLQLENRFEGSGVDNGGGGAQGSVRRLWEVPGNRMGHLEGWWEVQPQWGLLVAWA